MQRHRDGPRGLGVVLDALGPPLDRRDGNGTWLAVWTSNDSLGDTKSIVAYDAATGDMLWRKAGSDTNNVFSLSLSAVGDRVFYMDNDFIYCVDLKTGKPLWKSPFETEGYFTRNYVPTLVLTKDVAVCLTYKKIAALSVASGAVLWEKDKGQVGFASPAVPSPSQSS